MWKIDRGSTTGMTTASYVSVLLWHTAELGTKTLLLKNTHGSLSLKFKMWGYVTENGIAKELVTENVLYFGEIAEFHYDRQWDTLVLEVKNGSGSATYQIDYEGQGA